MCIRFDEEKVLGKRSRTGKGDAGALVRLQAKSPRNGGQRSYEILLDRIVKQFERNIDVGKCCIHLRRQQAEAEVNLVKLVDMLQAFTDRSSNLFIVELIGKSLACFLEGRRPVIGIARLLTFVPLPQRPCPEFLLEVLEVRPPG